MTIRAKLFAAIVLTVLLPVVIIGVALAAFGTLTDRFDDVARRAALQQRALELKFAVTDMNGWQTAYGYDGGRSRPRFVAAAEATRAQIAAARRALTAPDERALLARIERSYADFMALDREAYRALRAGRAGETGGSSSGLRSSTSRRWPPPRTSSRRSRAGARPPRVASSPRQGATPGASSSPSASAPPW